MNLWIDGQQDEAVRRFLAIEWDRLRFNEESIFSRKESELPDMPQARWQMLARDAQEAGLVLRQICKQIAARADQLAFEKEYAQAEQMLESVRQCGRVVSPPDSLLILRAIGIAIQKLAIEQMIHLYEASDQLDKIPPCRAALKDLDAQSAALRQEAQQIPARTMERLQRLAAERAAASQPAE